MKENIFLVRLPLICNFNCFFCFLEKRDNEKSNFLQADYFRQINVARQLKSRKIIFAGGEATLIEQLPLFIMYAKKQGIKEVEIQTNALKFHYKSYVKELKDAGLDSVLVGLHSHEEKKFDTLTQTNNYFPLVLEGINNLFKYKIDVSFNHAITTLTYRALDGYVRFIVENFKNPRNMLFTLVYPCGQAWKYKELIPRASDVKPYLLKAWKLCQKKKIPFYIPHCGMPGFPLCLIDDRNRGNLKGLISSGRTDIRSKEFDCENLKTSDCPKCRYDKVCVGIALNYKKLFGMTEFKLNP